MTRAAAWCAAALLMLCDVAAAQTPAPNAGGDVVAQVNEALKTGDVAKAQALIDASDGGNYQAVGDKLRAAGVYGMAQYSYLQAMTKDGFPNKRPVARKARLTLVKMLSGPYAPDLTKIPDGDYKGACPGYLDLVRVTVNVKDHQITKLSVQSRDDRPRGANEAIPKAIVDKQGLKDVNVITGATISSEAVMCATAAALKNAEK